MKCGQCQKETDCKYGIMGDNITFCSHDCADLYTEKMYANRSKSTANFASHLQATYGLEKAVYCCVLETAGLRTTDKPWKDYALYTDEQRAKEHLAAYKGKGCVEIWGVNTREASEHGVVTLWFKEGYAPCSPDQLQPDPGPVAISSARITMNWIKHWAGVVNVAVLASWLLISWQQAWNHGWRTWVSIPVCFAFFLWACLGAKR
jgi:hypothetical protein